MFYSNLAPKVNPIFFFDIFLVTLLQDQLTGREMLILYSRLRGVPENDIKDSIDLIIKLIGITPHADKYASTYSGTACQPNFMHDWI